MTELSSESSANSAATNDNVSNAEDNWEVQDILAERQTLSGESEMLAVWKCTWIPASSVKHGPVLSKWWHTNKFKTGHDPMNVSLPVIRGTQLHKDCTIIRKSLADRDVAVTPTVDIAGSKKKKGSATKRRRA
jgi:hypothetical protein